MTTDSTSPANTTVTAEAIEALQAMLGEEQVITGKKTDKYSKDFYWYSPILKEMLEDKRAEVALRVKSKEQLQAAVAFLYKENIPVVIRGGGSGNYGQLIPLYGGAVIDVTGLNSIFSVDKVLHAEAGATIRKIEIAAMEKGYEMPCIPSTWVISTIGGFLCGGSGGIGSIKNGGIAYKDNVKSVTIMTMEAEPKFLKFEERDAIKALHTYGTTGIMVEVEMRLAKTYPWEQLIFVHDDWQELLDWSYEIACDDTIPKRLVTVFENPISNFFKPLRKHIPADKHTTFFMVDAPCAEKIIASAKTAGIEHVFSKPFGNPPKPPYITDYTWNHTTLWAIKAEPNITYLQCGFGEDFSEKFDKLKAKFGDEVLIHVEMTLGNSKFRTEKPGVTIGGIPLIRYTTEERLNEIIAFCESLDIAIANPHTYTMEGGGVHPDISEKQALKDQADPKGLLNPGKMASYPHNPFATVEV
jgi:hypothetical protein